MSVQETNQPLDIEALKALEEKATPGEAWKFRCIYRTDGDRYYARSPLSSCRDDAFADADFINAFRTAVPQLIAEVERLKAKERENTKLIAEVERLTVAVEHLKAIGDSDRDDLNGALVDNNQLRQRVKELEEEVARWKQNSDMWQEVAPESEQPDFGEIDSERADQLGHAGWHVYPVGFQKLEAYTCIGGEWINPYSSAGSMLGPLDCAHERWLVDTSRPPKAEL